MVRPSRIIRYQAAPNEPRYIARIGFEAMQLGSAADVEKERKKMKRILRKIK
jgi:hypothetical protein